MIGSGCTHSDAVGLELVGVRSHEDLVTANLRGDDLSNDVAVGEADDEAVLGRIVLVLGLSGQALAGIVIGLALAAALVLDLVPPWKTLEIVGRAKERRAYEKYASFLTSLDYSSESAIDASNPNRSSLQRLSTHRQCEQPAQGIVVAQWSE